MFFKSAQKLLMTIAMAIFFAGCGPTPLPVPPTTPPDTGIGTSVIRFNVNDTSGAKVTGVSVDAVSIDGQAIATYTVIEAAPGEYFVEYTTNFAYADLPATLTLTKPGFDTEVVNDAGKVHCHGAINYYETAYDCHTHLYTETLTALTDVEATGTGDLSGVIKDSTSSSVLQSVTVDLRNGSDNKAGAIAYTTSSDIDGNYSFIGAAAGYYTAEVSFAGYFSEFVNVVVVGSGIRTEDFNLTPTIAAGEIRVVLTWGEIPFDLDAHMSGPDGVDSRFHVFFGNPTASNVTLDLDDTGSYGPETITISTQNSGVYRYSVHDFTNSGLVGSNALSASQAEVKVFNNSGLIAQYTVPAQPGNTWKVFELDGATITELGTLVDVAEADSPVF